MTTIHDGIQDGMEDRVIHEIQTFIQLNLNGNFDEESQETILHRRSLLEGNLEIAQDALLQTSAKLRNSSRNLAHLELMMESLQRINFELQGELEFVEHVSDEIEVVKFGKSEKPRIRHVDSIHSGSTLSEARGISCYSTESTYSLISPTTYATGSCFFPLIAPQEKTHDKAQEKVAFTHHINQSCPKLKRFSYRNKLSEISTHSVLDIRSQVQHDLQRELALPLDFTDPDIRFIMEGEYLMKASHGILKNTYKRRFVWVNPQSLTLYWYPKDPGTQRTLCIQHPNRARQAHSVQLLKLLNNRYLSKNVDPSLTLVLITTSRQLKLFCPNTQSNARWVSGLSKLIG
ncbi:hypothetical protein DSO57_1029242 [Entomophthora muscae]|uniref:Uncharacterized protein n=1 Tax=Entomophthora muscae TaxID=34485 RepID=A0ACC2RGB2_9FUNG|nr:hypothetical protein DSO57_1029242 [Entomophthora muscae]